jgi:DNA polymerase I
MQKKLFLLDALALVFRAYYALIRNPRLTSSGRNTNAQFGFTNTLLDLINNQKPTHLAVCFDTSAPTERHTDFTDYKANRQEAPEDLRAALPDIKKIVDAFNIPVIAMDGYEADDVIGTLSKQAELAGYEVYMVTPDKDYGQVVSDSIYIYKPPYQGGSFEIIGPKEVCEKWDISSVNQVIDILGLMGDAVDNIPGIPGVGEKTAAKLLKEYHTLEAVLDNAEKIKGALGQKVQAGKESAIMSKKLATIITDVPVAFHEEDFRLKEWDREKIKAIFAELEFKTLGKRLLGEEPDANTPPVAIEKATMAVQTDLFGNVTDTPEPATPAGEAAEFMAVEKNIQNTPHTYHLVDDAAAIKALVNTLSAAREICFDTETTGIDANEAELVGLSFAIQPHEAWYVPCPPDREATLAILEQFAGLFANPDKTWVGQNIKYDLLMLKWYGYELTGALFDTMLNHYVVEPDGKRSMDQLSTKYLGYEPVAIEELIGKKGKGQGSMRDVPLDKIKEYACNPS